MHLIGAGRLGRTLARAWYVGGHVALGAIVGRDAARVADACRFIGDGTPQTALPTMPAELWLIATPDDQLPAVAIQVGRSGALRPGDIVFHCAGSVPAEILADCRTAGAAIASLHPLLSFADPATALHQLANAAVAVEGDAAALAVLRPLFAALGCRDFAIDPARKTLYHAAAVLACNDLIALMQAALDAMDGAGVPAATAWSALRPLVMGSLAQIDATLAQPESRHLAPALTGPVARGDIGTVLRQRQAMHALDPTLGAVYTALAQQALKLAAAQSSPPPAERLAALRDGLSEPLA